jgi:hypothetical protein
VILCRGRAFIFGDKMPTNRLLLTLEEVKKIIAKHYNTPIENIDIFDCSTLKAEDLCGFVIAIKENTYLFQIDSETGNI